jgi:hypothetical protein
MSPSRREEGLEEQVKRAREPLARIAPLASQLFSLRLASAYLSLMVRLSQLIESISSPSSPLADRLAAFLQLSAACSSLSERDLALANFAHEQTLRLGASLLEEMRAQLRELLRRADWPNAFLAQPAVLS